MTTAILQIATYRADGSRDCLSTVNVPAQHRPMRHHLAGLQWTATGYGKRIPTEWMVLFGEKWRRVYCRIYSNAGTCYIGTLSPVGERIIVDIESE